LAPPPPQQAGASRLLRAGPPASAATGTQCLGFCLGTLPLAPLGPATPDDVSTLAFSRSMQEPQTRITPPLRRTPPGQQRGQPPGSSREQIRFSVSMSSQPVSTPHTTTPVPGKSPDQTILERLPDPHLTRSSLAFSLIAHHDGLQPTQHRVVWRPPPQGRHQRASNPPSLAQHRFSEAASYISLLLRS